MAMQHTPAPEINSHMYTFLLFDSAELVGKKFPSHKYINNNN